MEASDPVQIDSHIRTTLYDGIIDSEFRQSPDSTLGTIGHTTKTSFFRILLILKIAMGHNKYWPPDQSISQSP